MLGCESLHVKKPSSDGPVRNESRQGLRQDPLQNDFCQPAAWKGMQIFKMVETKKTLERAVVWLRDEWQTCRNTPDVLAWKDLWCARALDTNGSCCIYFERGKKS